MPPNEFVNLQANEIKKVPNRISKLLVERRTHAIKWIRALFGIIDRGEYGRNESILRMVLRTLLCLTSGHDSNTPLETEYTNEIPIRNDVVMMMMWFFFFRPFFLFCYSSLSAFSLLAARRCRKLVIYKLAMNLSFVYFTSLVRGFCWRAHKLPVARADCDDEIVYLQVLTEDDDNKAVGFVLFSVIRFPCLI